MTRHPDGPTQARSEQDKLLGGIATLQRVLRRTQALNTALDKQTNGERWTEGELQAARHQYACEIEALQTAIATMEAAISVPRLQHEALTR